MNAHINLSAIKRLCVYFALSLAFFAIPIHGFAADPAEPATTDPAPAVSPLKTEINTQAKALAGEKGAGYGMPSDTRLIAAEIIRIFLTFLGTMFSVYTIYGGYLWMTSAGNEERITKAQSILLHGILGVFVMFFSYTLAFFVVKQVIGKAYQDEYISYWKWGVLAPGQQNVEGKDPLGGKNDPLGGYAPTPKGPLKFFANPKN